MLEVGTYSFQVGKIPLLCRGMTRLAAVMAVEITVSPREGRDDEDYVGLLEVGTYSFQVGKIGGGHGGCSVFKKTKTVYQLYEN